VVTRNIAACNDLFAANQNRFDDLKQPMEQPLNFGGIKARQYRALLMSGIDDFLSAVFPGMF